MKLAIRFALLAALLCTTACGDDEPDHDHAAHPHAGKGGSASAGKGGSEAGTKQTDAGVTQSALERPGSLPRPPKTGLPAELRPPR